VGGDHREAVAEGHDDRRLDAGERRWQDDVLGHGREPAPVGSVVPVDAEQVPRVGGVGLDGGQLRPGRCRIVAGSMSWANVGRTVRVSR